MEFDRKNITSKTLALIHLFFLPKYYVCVLLFPSIHSIYVAYWDSIEWNTIIAEVKARYHAHRLSIFKDVALQAKFSSNCFIWTPMGSQLLRATSRRFFMHVLLNLSNLYLPACLPSLPFCPAALALQLLWTRIHFESRNCPNKVLQIQMIRLLRLPLLLATPPSRLDARSARSPKRFMLCSGP